ncbi:MAG: DUF4337 family protein [Phycisphaerae bacterium]
MADAKVPEQLKSDVPLTLFGRILLATPVVMAVVATMLAGLSSSEMTRAQYDRAMAAQLQSKAGDQWSYFQAKKLRGATQRNTLDLLEASGDLGPLSVEALTATAGQLVPYLQQVDAEAKKALQAAPAGGTDALNRYLKGSSRRNAEAEKVQADHQATLKSPETTAALGAMLRAQAPDIGPQAPLPPEMAAAVKVMEESVSEDDIKAAVGKLNDQAISEALRAAKARPTMLDSANGPIAQCIDRVETLLGRGATLLKETREAGLKSLPPAPWLLREFAAARMRFSVARYDAEARLNQAIANLIELQVRRSNLSSERHQARSQRFFYGMLAAQMAVIVATFSIAARKRNLLWTLAAGAGLVAVLFGAYVYLYI